MPDHSKAAVVTRVECTGKSLHDSAPSDPRPALFFVRAGADPEDVLRATAKIVSRRYAVRRRP